MFRITKKADYAIFLLCHLTQRQGDADPTAAPVLASAQEIADAAGLGKPLVANLLKAMTRGGLLGSVRGTHGGYHLARPAHEIALAEILEAVEGPMFLVACAAEDAVIPTPSRASATPTTRSQRVDHADCELTHCCPSRSAMRLVHERVQQLFADINLHELARASHDPLAALAVGGPIASLTGGAPQRNEP